MTRERFETIADEEFAALPEPFRQRMENVRIVIEDVDSPAQRRQAGLGRSSMLLGLYEGVPLPRRGVDYGVVPVMPDTITLFQKNIESIARSESEVRRQIRETLIHEIAHYFGMDEDDIREAGY
jgi:predicted Zn-dependent protease with MMP-like domain